MAERHSSPIKVAVSTAFQVDKVGNQKEIRWLFLFDHSFLCPSLQEALPDG